VPTLTDFAALPPAPSDLRPENTWLLDRLEPFVVARPASLTRMNLRPFGVPVAEGARIDPLHRRAAPLLDRLARLDAVAFGPSGMSMPRWVFYDCAELPGGIVGLGARAGRASSDARAMLEVPEGYSDIVPYAMYIAIPTLEPGVWVGHNLATVAGRVEGVALRGLGGLTKALALKVFGASAQIGVTQWSSPALHVHARLGPLELLTAWTPAHSEPASLTYRAAVDDQALRSLARDPSGSVERPPADAWIDSADHAALRALQDRIEGGERLRVVGPPRPFGAGRQLVPIGAATAPR
jgi:hypothetical protein